MLGLTLTDASTASLLLTLEGAATALLAWLIFRESFDRRIAFGVLCLVVGAIAVSWSGTPTLHRPRPAGHNRRLYCVGAGQQSDAQDFVCRPVADRRAERPCCRTCQSVVGSIGRRDTSGPFPALIGVIVGFFSYGVSLVLFVMALRHLGTARTGAYFSMAPFFGAVVAVVMGEPITGQLILAGAFMAAGVWLLVTERHEHEHVHDSLEHSHAHVHDENHQHDHGPEAPGRSLIRTRICTRS